MFFLEVGQSGNFEKILDKWNGWVMKESLEDPLFGNLIDVKLLHKLSTRACKLMNCMCIVCARSPCGVSNS